MQRRFTFGLLIAALAWLPASQGLAFFPLQVALSEAVQSGAAPASETGRSAPPSLAIYGALPSVELVQVSPSGARVAFISVTGEARRLMVIDVAARQSLGGVDVGELKVRDLDWIGDERVLITTSSTETNSELGIIKNELFAGQIFELGRRRIAPMLTGTPGLFPALMGPVDVIRRPRNPDVLVRAYSFRAPARMDLYSVDPATGRARPAETMSSDVADYILDATGRSVARSQYQARSKVWSLHLRRNGEFTEAWRTTAPLDPPALIGLGMNGDSVIVAAKRPEFTREGQEDARFFDVNLETGAWRPVRFDFDPGGLVFHPLSRRLIGATRMEDAGRRYAFADPDADSLWAAVEQALPDRSPALVSWNDTLRVAAVFTSGMNDPGTYHLIDLDASALIPIGKAYPNIAVEQFASVAPLTYRATDGLEIPAYLTTPPGRAAADLPLVVLAHGGPASRDGGGFDWWAQALASRGYAVLQANFRGSTGYGDAFMEAGYGEWGRKMQTDLSDGVRHLVEQGVVDPGRVCIVGASYGGYAALAGATLDPGVYRCAVSVAGVSDLRRMIVHASGQGERRDNSAVRYWTRFMGADAPGDRSLDARSPARLADRVEAPILLIHGRDDIVVPVEQSRLMADALRRAGKPVDMVELAGEDHWLSRGDTRTRMLTETVRFLEANNPAD